MILERLQTWLSYLVRFAVATSLAALVILDVTSGTTFHIPKIISDWMARQADSGPEKQDEIRKYVIFVDVPHGSHTVVTGVEYASDQNRQITKQWCYIDGSITGGRKVRLTLAKMDGAGSLIHPSYSPTALADFDLSRTDARSLAASHCRFQ